MNMIRNEEYIEGITHVISDIFHVLSHCAAFFVVFINLHCLDTHAHDVMDVCVLCVACCSKHAGYSCSDLPGIFLCILNVAL